MALVWCLAHKQMAAIIWLNGLIFGSGYQNSALFQNSYRDFQIVRVAADGSQTVLAVVDQVDLGQPRSCSKSASIAQASPQPASGQSVSVAGHTPALGGFGPYTSDSDSGIGYDDLVVQTNSGGSNSYQVTEDVTLNLDVLANDSDPDGDSLIITQIDGQAIATGATLTLANGSDVTLNADGTLDYVHNDTAGTLDDGAVLDGGFSYTISDSNGGSDTANVSVDVGRPNRWWQWQHS